MQTNNFISFLRKNALVLIITSLITIPIPLLSYNYLYSRLEQASNDYLKATIDALGDEFPKQDYNNDLAQDCYVPVASWQQPNEAKVEQLFIAKKDNTTTGYIVVGSTNRGYNGYIQVMLVTDAQGVIKALRIINQTETPGLGTKVITTPWVDEFKGLSLDDSAKQTFAVKKYGGIINQFTGATITPNAIVGQVRGVMNDTVKELVYNQQQVLASKFISCKLAK